MPSLLFPEYGAITLKAKVQAKLLRRAVGSQEPLCLILSDAGLRYDDLVYERSDATRRSKSDPIALDDLRLPENGIPIVSFFSGCGGMDLGMEAAGFKQLAAFEINELFCKTLRRNRPYWRVFGPPTHSGDVSKAEEIGNALRPLIGGRPFEGLFIGGPPCQPFSIAANQRYAKWGDNFKRTGFAHEKNGNLLFDLAHLITEFKPRSFVIENVPGLRDIDGGRQLSEAILLLERAGYIVEAPFVLDAAHYGVAQQRQRLFVVGNRVGRTLTRPTPQNSTIGAWSALRKGLGKSPNHETREHRAESVLRYMKLDYGERDQLGRVDRLDPALPSKTVIAGGTKGGGRSHLHPEIPRTLSVRESARLQSFPDDYVFLGPTARQFTQVGNAVPPVLAAQIGVSVLRSYFQ